jgi:hypothetical protein
MAARISGEMGEMEEVKTGTVGSFGGGCASSGLGARAASGTCPATKSTIGGSVVCWISDAEAQASMKGIIKESIGIP